MIKRFYYYRDEDKHPRITVCVIEKDGAYHRGVAICAPDDRVIKSKGRVRASGRVDQALHHQKSIWKSVREDVWDMLLELIEEETWTLIADGTFGHEQVCVGGYNATLTEFEEKLFADPTLP